MDAYTCYNKIKVDPLNVPKTMFMSNTDNYYYNAMPFKLKSVVATYDRLMDTTFSEQIGNNLEVYLDDMIVKNL